MSTVHGALRATSATLDDIEALRIATENRHRALTRTEPDADGEERGLGLPEAHPLVRVVSDTLAGLATMEHALTLQLQRELRQTPFAAWQKSQGGVGEKQLARLLAAIGDPYLVEIDGEEPRPRGLRSLWAYGGYAVDGGQARRPKKGATQEDLFACGSPAIKMRAFLIATSCIKAKGHMRDVYDADRAATADAVHAVECRRCGPSGKPAQPGTPLSAGHQHARALRKVAKEVLRDLWRVAKDHHETREGSAHSRRDSQSMPGASLAA